MSELVTLAVGSRLYVSPSLPNEQSAAAYAELPFVFIKGVRDAGEIDERHNTVTRSPLGLDFGYQERVGIVLPSLTWEAVRLSGDPGQRLLFDAFDGPEQAFCIEHTDGTRVYFTAAVSARSRIIVDGSTILAWRYELNLQSKPIES